MVRADWHSPNFSPPLSVPSKARACLVARGVDAEHLCIAGNCTGRDAVGYPCRSHGLLKVVESLNRADVAQYSVFT